MHTFSRTTKEKVVCNCLKQQCLNKILRREMPLLMWPTTWRRS